MIAEARPLAWLGAFVRRDAATSRASGFGRIVEYAGILLSVVTFYFLGRLVDSGSSPALAGHRYFTFAVSGMAMAALLYQVIRSYVTALRHEQVAGSLEALFVTPLAGWQIAVGLGLRGTTRGVARTLVFLLFGALLGAFEPALRLLWLPIVLALAIAAFLPFALVAASYVLVFQRGDPVGYLTNAATLLLAGVYFPSSVLPEGLALASDFYPGTHAVAALRLVTRGGEGLTGHLIWLLGFAVVAFPLATWLFERSVASARRRGTLGRA